MCGLRPAVATGVAVRTLVHSLVAHLQHAVVVGVLPGAVAELVAGSTLGGASVGSVAEHLLELHLPPLAPVWPEWPIARPVDGRRIGRGPGPRQRARRCWRR